MRIDFELLRFHRFNRVAFFQLANQGERLVPIFQLALCF